ncbi:Nucleotide-binding oligomerization domain-containing protein 1 (Caspase recruitment domain-containing protein 4) [Durusdinium trenchii]|uniref:Nucleotide-binding oligomerization domain-containing protein 1 (Caspase recruitment domain-containing protein 4) n=1 Tax=Durusdinium trenchii TaxID=1381693 RepID=A0ABP0SAP0_9DINO
MIANLFSDKDRCFTLAMGQSAGCDNLPCCTKDSSASQEVVRARPVAYCTYEATDGQQLAKGALPLPSSFLQATKSDEEKTKKSVDLTNPGASANPEFKAFAEALGKHQVATQIHLWGGEIKDEGAKVLAAALRQYRSVTKIDLGYNGITDEGAKALIEALRQNRSITNVNLLGNDISAEVLWQIEEALKANRAVAVAEAKVSARSAKGDRACCILS